MARSPRPRKCLAVSRRSNAGTWRKRSPSPKLSPACAGTALWKCAPSCPVTGVRRYGDAVRARRSLPTRAFPRACAWQFAISQTGLFRIQFADAVIGPLADDAIVIRAQRVQHRARAGAVAIFAFRFATGGPAGAVMHNRPVIVRRAAHQPVRFRNPIVIRLPAGLDVFVVDRHKFIAIPPGMLVEKAQDVAEFVG